MLFPPSFYQWILVAGRARWTGNLRDLGASVMRLATLATAGRIYVQTIDEEIARLCRQWNSWAKTSPLDGLLPDDMQLDPLDLLQLEAVVQVCRRSKSLSAAGRELVAASRTQRASTNDADRLRKYLARFGLDWAAIREA